MTDVVDTECSEGTTNDFVVARTNGYNHSDREIRYDVRSPDLQIKIVSCYFTVFKIK